MPLQSLPSSAESYAVAQRQESQAAIAAVLRQWRRMTPDFDTSWARIAPTIEAITSTAQQRMAADAQLYIPAVLEDTGQIRSLASSSAVSYAPLVGVAGDGRPMSSLMYGAVTGAKERVGAGASAFTALREQSKWLSMAVGTALSDTGRASENLAMGVRPVSGYVRMLMPPSCSRCAVLAGKWSRKSEAFRRHPGCDCRNIPAAESVSADLTVNPTEYFQTLSAAEQDATFTKAGAEAIRNGADLTQVVNARRGMQVAQIGGRQTLITLEGTTRRGYAYQFLFPSSSTAIRRVGSRLSAANRPRIMPETIARVATSNADYLRLLSANGYLR